MNDNGMYCPKCRDFTDNAPDPEDRCKVICKRCGRKFTLQDSNCAMLKDWGKI